MFVQGISNKIIRSIIYRKVSNKIYPVIDDFDFDYVVEISKVVWEPTKYSKAIGYNRFGKYTFNR
jgi:hypothetical protein